MSEEVKIDEKYIRSVALKAAELSKFIMKQAEIMIDEHEDMFVRYLSFAHLNGIIKGVAMVMEISRDAIGMGYNLHHPFMQTPKAIENGWDKINLEQDLFFTTDEQEKYRSFVDMIDTLKENEKEANKETTATH